MIHARQDYNRIQDPANLIPADEPVFLIRAQDDIAAEVVSIWAALHEMKHGPSEISKMVKDHALQMAAWPQKKAADLPTIANRKS